MDPVIQGKVPENWSNGLRWWWRLGCSCLFLVGLLVASPPFAGAADSGVGTSVDSRDCAERAAKDSSVSGYGRPPAQCLVAATYAQGRSGTTDASLAVIWLRMAADLGDIETEKVLHGYDR